MRYLIIVLLLSISAVSAQDKRVIINVVMCGDVVYKYGLYRGKQYVIVYMSTIMHGIKDIKSNRAQKFFNQSQVECTLGSSSCIIKTRTSKPVGMRCNKTVSEGRAVEA